MTWQFIALWSIAALHPLFRYRILPYPPIDAAGKPQPDPWKILVPGILAVAGGLAGGWTFYSTWISRDKVSGLAAAATAVGAYLASTLLLGIYRLAAEGRATTALRD